MHAKNSLFLDTFQSAAEKARVHFDLIPPFTPEELKTAFKKKCKELHPDAGGTDVAFQEMHDAYLSLVRLQKDIGGIFSEAGGNGTASEAEGINSPYYTTDGTPLSELGLGLGPMKNGAECAECGGKGYNPRKNEVYGRHVDCRYCNARGSIPREIPCEACNATGKFTQKRTKRVVDCKKCNGTGRFKHPRLVTECIFCMGRGRRFGIREGVGERYERCWECKGTGETEVWNPALPKGRLW